MKQQLIARGVLFFFSRRLKTMGTKTIIHLFFPTKKS